MCWEGETNNLDHENNPWKIKIQFHNSLSSNCTFLFVCLYLPAYNNNGNDNSESQTKAEQA